MRGTGIGELGTEEVPREKGFIIDVDPDPGSSSRNGPT